MAMLSAAWGAPNVNRPHEAGLARWRTDATGGNRVELHVHAGADAPPGQDDAVELGLAGHVVRSAPDERREEVVSEVEFIDRLESDDAVQGRVRAHLSLKNLADVLVVEVVAPVAFHQRERGHPLREGHFNGPIGIVLALGRDGCEQERSAIAPVETGNAGVSNERWS